MESASSQAWLMTRLRRSTASWQAAIARVHSAGVRWGEMSASGTSEYQPARSASGVRSSWAKTCGSRSSRRGVGLYSPLRLSLRAGLTQEIGKLVAVRIEVQLQRLDDREPVERAYVIWAEHHDGQPPDDWSQLLLERQQLLHRSQALQGGYRLSEKPHRSRMIPYGIGDMMLAVRNPSCNRLLACRHKGEQPSTDRGVDVNLLGAQRFQVKLAQRRGHIHQACLARQDPVPQERNRHPKTAGVRSEERRVGKECRSR